MAKQTSGPELVTTQHVQHMKHRKPRLVHQKGDHPRMPWGHVLAWQESREERPSEGSEKHSARWPSLPCSCGCSVCKHQRKRVFAMRCGKHVLCVWVPTGPMSSPAHSVWVPEKAISQAISRPAHKQHCLGDKTEPVLPSLSGGGHGRPSA